MSQPKSSVFIISYVNQQMEDYLDLKKKKKKKKKKQTSNFSFWHNNSRYP